MSRIDVIKFEAKFSLIYTNGVYSLSGFDHIIVIKILEEDLEDILDSGIASMNMKEWNDYATEYNESN